MPEKRKSTRAHKKTHDAAAKRERERMVPRDVVPEGALSPLDDLEDFELADGVPDVTGWDVVDANGRRVGDVHTILVDTAAGAPRYLDIEVDHAVMDTDDDRHLLIPVGCARVDAQDDRIQVTTLEADALAGTPLYDHRPVTREFEQSVRRCHSARLADAPPAEEDFYASQMYDARRFWADRGVDWERPLVVRRAD
ncbi:MAG TPA: PRC-barrel domain-containing protein [Gemmatimonadaceae bacterium]|nr:PRC-barrel domain-containing protein [Gemmatimonadaceae bacterium]